MIQQESKRAALPPRLDVIEALAEQIPNALWAVWRLVPREKVSRAKFHIGLVNLGSPKTSVMTIRHSGLIFLRRARGTKRKKARPLVSASLLAPIPRTTLASAIQAVS